MYIDKSCSAGALIIKFNILKKKRFCNVILSYSKKALQTHTGKCIFVFNMEIMVKHECSILLQKNLSI